ncbi:hypothetical protein RhiirA4_474677 [Rhizophagus irregularis]|uniref:Uncharacterized protein n=1 Tax=Rhizophagus irregularis TaxID=588596 RepID=A0A2I1H8W8_9GLOM|nr:hypothetical protein RhiirA4_474677 [Rhizophagus irregularis]
MPNFIIFDKDIYGAKHIYDLQLEMICKNLLYQANGGKIDITEILSEKNIFKSALSRKNKKKSDSNFEEVECPGKETAEALSKKFFKKLFLSFYRTSLERGLRPWIPNMFERKFQTTNRNGLAFRNPAFGMSRWFCTSEWWMQSRERRMET